MSADAGSPAQRFGYFGRFMVAWGKADESTREEVYADALAYWRGELSDTAEVADVSAALGIPGPTSLP